MVSEKLRETDAPEQQLGTICLRYWLFGFEIPRRGGNLHATSNEVQAMKFTFLASAAVVALTYATPGFAAVSETSMAGEAINSCPVHSVRASHVDWRYARRLLAARAHNHLHAATHAAAKVATHAPAPTQPAVVRVASLEDRLAGVSCGGASASVLCPGYQLLGIAY